MGFTKVLSSLFERIKANRLHKEEIIDIKKEERNNYVEDEINSLVLKAISEVKEIINNPAFDVNKIEDVDNVAVNGVLKNFSYTLDLQENTKFEDVLHRLEVKEIKQKKKENTLSYADMEAIFEEKIGKKFSFMYNKYFEKLKDYVYRFVLDMEVAEDLASESMMKSLEAIDTFDVSKNIQYNTWLYRIAKNHTLGYFKRKDCNNITMDAPVDEGGATLKDYLAEDVDEETNHEVDIAQIKVAVIKKYVEVLDDKYKQALIMRDFQHMSYEEISEALNIKLNTTKSRIHSARNKIQELVREEFEEIENTYLNI